MIGLIFRFGGEVIEVRVDYHSITFRSSTYGTAFVPIDALSFSKEGVLKEHPDLADNPAWKTEAIIRFKTYIKGLDSENKVVDYIISDLGKFGYTLIAKQKQGHRVEVINVR